MASRTMTTQRKPPTGSHLKRGNQQSDKCEAFCIALANKLDALEQAVHPKWMTLEWVSVAVEFMRTTYSDMVTLFEELRALSQDVRGSEDFWVEEYMVESMKLLDVCNVIKPAMSRFEHLMMCVQLVVQASQRLTNQHLHSLHLPQLSYLELCEFPNNVWGDIGNIVRV